MVGHRCTTLVKLPREAHGEIDSLPLDTWVERAGIFLTVGLALVGLRFSLRSVSEGCDADD